MTVPYVYAGIWQICPIFLLGGQVWTARMQNPTQFFILFYFYAVF